jgi:predicted transposase YdaD
MSLERSRFYQEIVEKLKAEGKAEGRAEGKAEGEQLGRQALLRSVCRQLGRHLALPGPAALARMETLSLEALEQLEEDLLAFTSPQDLDLWLARH